MSDQKPAPVPPPSALQFEQGISHPDLWLWDSWTAEAGGTLHLYSLALSRTGTEGRPITPDDRNAYPFHIRHFTSADGGQRWQDRGVFLSPQAAGDGAYARNVWSGCMLARSGAPWLCGFTGIRHAGPGRPFLQTICIGLSTDGSRLDQPPGEALLCPDRDYNQILSAGYYLPPQETLGAHDGEDGGPILAWRDPFILEAGNGRFEVFWSAKISPTRGAVAHATIREDGGSFQVETLHPPITLPDDHAFTQAEVPKIHQDPKSGNWYLLISACDRLNETQPSEEVTKVLRLYRASAMRGPWTGAFQGNSSLVQGAGHLFGASLLRADFSKGLITLIAPYTEYAPEETQLTFAPPFLLELPRESAELLNGLRQG